MSENVLELWISDTAASTKLHCDVLKLLLHLLYHPHHANHVIRKHDAVRGRLQISARNYPSRQPPSGSDSVRDSPSTHSPTPVAGEWEVWLETVVVWWKVSGFRTETPMHICKTPTHIRKTPTHIHKTPTHIRKTPAHMRKTPAGSRDRAG
ncbi:hypothetical protein M422DRAFT_271349 [Sphaerobolus stellatus SS14]|uniref:Uncharacterized protein n=1 Tax=Sphaerobolus stellatus (strain SS14) TaxID=990650 RepID=A0A0C9UEQ9_SPHS4|nr:hypothetical protein M422DRAFT_271349 [Sphaerobolus stellatus SS14]